MNPSFFDDAGILQEFESFIPQLPTGYLHCKLVHARYLEAVDREDEAAALLESCLAAYPEDLQSLNEVALHYEIHNHLHKAEKKWALSLKYDMTDKALVGLLRTLYNQDMVFLLSLLTLPALQDLIKAKAYVEASVFALQKFCWQLPHSL
ncbi:MAG TPA: hypothetical protein DC024_13340 [Clostridiales bacterium]|nr:hypothetical protein [Clostridiales bacterium]